MTIKINKKIKNYSVVQADEFTADMSSSQDKSTKIMAEVIQMHEKVERPDVLIGSTYKIRSPLFDHALYVTINDIVLNSGTEHESRRPFEIFINSKNMDHFQWIVALTRIMSAVFRKGGDVTFLVEEMKAVFDPRGGYFKAGGVYMPSIVAEIGAVVEEHLKMIGMLHDPELSPEQQRLIAEKRAAYEARQQKKTTTELASADAESVDVALSDKAMHCPKCQAHTMVIMDGCATCLTCGHSKCG